MTGASLDFFDTSDDLASKVATQWPAGCEILLDGNDAGNAKSIIGLLQATGRSIAITPTLAELATDCSGHIRPPQRGDYVIVAAADGTSVTHTLWGYRQLSDLKVLAPRSDHFWNRRFFFVICPPKTGGHMLMNFLGQIGFKFSLPISGMIPDGRVYFANGVDQHAEFALDPYHAPSSLMQALASTVCLFLVRDPRDVAVSLAHFLHAPPQQFRNNENLPPLYSSWHPYFSSIPDQNERLLRIIEGRDGWPSLERFLAPFEPWSSQPNTVTLHYEDLVGEAGGGSAERQQMAVWQFQLACHFPGSTASLCQKLYDTRSATYRSGKIGAYLDEFQPAHVEAYHKLRSAPLAANGYEGKATLLKPFRLALPPRLPGSHLARAVRTKLALDIGSNAVCETDGSTVICGMAGDSSERPEITLPQSFLVQNAENNTLARTVAQIAAFLEQSGFLLYPKPREHGPDRITLSTPLAAVQYPRPTSILQTSEYSILGYGNTYLAIATSLDNIDVTTIEAGQFRKFVSGGLIVHANSLNTLLSELRIDLPAAVTAEQTSEQSAVPETIEHNVFGFNLVSFAGKIFAVSLQAGAIDLRDAIQRQKLASSSLLFNFGTVSEAREILRLRHQVGILSSVVDHLIAATADVLPPATTTPQLLVSNYRGFNLVALGGEIFAVSLSTGPADLTDMATRDALQKSNHLLIAPNLTAAFDAVNRAITNSAAPDSGSFATLREIPQLLGEYRSYNLVRLGDRHAAIPQALGPVDLTEASSHTNHHIFWAGDEATLRHTVDQKGEWKHFDPLHSTTPLNAFGLPEVIEIEPIHTCNLRCIMCHVSYEQVTKQRLDIGFLKNLQGLKGKWAKLGHLYEPVAHPQFADIARGLTDLGLDIDLVTNGTLFTDTLIEEIADCNFRNVTISFDGARAETYERIRQRGNFNQAISRILAFKRAIQARKPDTYFQINYTILRSNIDEIVQAVQLWDEHGFDHIGFINMVIRDEAEILKREAVQPVLDSLESALDAAAHLVINEGRRITLSAPHFRHSNLQGKVFGNAPQSGLIASDNPNARLPITPSSHFQNGSYPGMQVDCRSPFKFARINYNGDVLLCHQFSIGNILDTPLLELWENPTAEHVRTMVMGDVAICEACEYFRYCIQANDVDSRRDYVSNNSIRVLKESWPYNFLTWNGRYYATPQWLRLTPTDLANRSRHSQLGIVMTSGLEEAEAAVADIFPPLEHSPAQPWKIEEYRGYALYACHDRLVAVPVSLGRINIRKMHGFTLDFRYWPYQRHAITGPSVIKVRQVIDEKIQLGLPWPRWR